VYRYSEGYSEGYSDVLGPILILFTQFIQYYPTSMASSISNFLLTAFFFHCSVALQCGDTLTTPCLGQTDIRYDPKSSNNAVDQAEGARLDIEFNDLMIIVP
jgi:hypothetical protein